MPRKATPTSTIERHGHRLPFIFLGIGVVLILVIIVLWFIAIPPKEIREQIRERSESATVIRESQTNKHPQHAVDSIARDLVENAENNPPALSNDAYRELILESRQAKEAAGQ